MPSMPKILRHSNDNRTMYLFRFVYINEIDRCYTDIYLYFWCAAFDVAAALNGVFIAVFLTLLFFFVVVALRKNYEANENLVASFTHSKLNIVNCLKYLCIRS